MTTSAASILARAATLIQDEGGVRWGALELVRWFNEGQRAVQIARPDVTRVTLRVKLAAGARQNLETLIVAPNRAPAKLIDINRNTAAGSNQAPVRLVPRSLLDAHTPAWQGAAASVSPLHYTYSPTEPNEFWVDPPAPVPPVAPATTPVAAEVELSYSAYPIDVTEPAGGAALADVDGDMDLPDRYGTALVNYVVFRALSKDAEYGGADRAGSYLSMFTSALSADVPGATVVQPQK